MTDEAADVVCEDVSYSYGRKPALSSVSFSLGAGVNGILGPNGAGKSTLMSILATMTLAQEGRVLVAGSDLFTSEGRARTRDALGYLPQRFDVMSSATVHDNVAYAAWAHGVPVDECAQAARDALATVDLTARSADKARKLSGGQRQRLGIACAIAHRPRVLLLDEPTVGIDPVQRIEVRRLLGVIGRDAVVVVTTHMVEDVARIASTVLVLREGRLIFDGTPAELAGKAPADGADDATTSPLESGYHALMSATGSLV